MVLAIHQNDHVAQQMRNCLERVRKINIWPRMKVFWTFLGQILGITMKSTINLELKRLYIQFDSLE